MNFRWRPGDPPPEIEEHSKAKLNVLRSYLRAYLDRLNVTPLRDEFKLDLVDGFSGGGTFTDADGIISGTPLIMLEESKAGQARLNRNRSKPLRFNFKYYFTDVDPHHTTYLKAVLKERGWLDNHRIVVCDNRFEDQADAIITEIQRRQPRAGRAIFLLDQTGFSQVRLDLVARILNQLAAAEVILTFAADMLINHLANTPSYIKAVSPLDLTDVQIQDLIHLKNDAGGRALAQRVLRDQIRNRTRATYDTPFFIRPKKSRRALWFIHLSRHPTARDVMIQQHWAISTFEHYGSGDFEMMGWDALRSEETLRLFGFEDIEAEEMRKRLLNTMPAKLHTLAVDEPITVQTMRHMLANQTAARFSDLDATLLQLAKMREIDILNRDGKLRSRSLLKLQPEDRIAMPQNLWLPGVGRQQY